MKLLGSIYRIFPRISLSTRTFCSPNFSSTLLLGGGGGEGAEVGLAGSDGGLGPDGHAAELATGGELEEVRAVDVDDVETGNILGGLDDAVVLVVDDDGTTGGLVLLATDLVLAGADLAVLEDTLEVGLETEADAGGVDILGLGHLLEGVVDDEGELGDLLDAMAAGHDERGHGGGGQGGGDGVTALGHVDLAVPAAPDAGGGVPVILFFE